MTSSGFRFSLDSSVGRLARWLRLLGHDAAWEPGDNLSKAFERARTEERFVVTRSHEVRRLGLSWPPCGGMILRKDGLADQLVELAGRWPLFSAAEPFTRCSTCNLRLEEIDPEEARPHVPDYVAKTQPKFNRCPACRRVYWEATHASPILTLFEEAAARSGQAIPWTAKKVDAGSGEPDPASQV